MCSLDALRMSWFEPDDSRDDSPVCDECGEPFDGDVIRDGCNRYCVPCVRLVAPAVYTAWVKEQGEEPPEIVPAGEVKG